MTQENEPNFTDSIVEDSSLDEGTTQQKQPQDGAGHSQGPAPIITKIADLQRMSIDELNHYAKKVGLRHLGSMTKSQMVFEIVKMLADRPNELLYGEGVLEVLPDGFGFLRSTNYNYLPSAEDIYVSPAQIRRFDLKKGDTIAGTIRPPTKSSTT